MSAYKDALHLSSTELGPRLELASELLAGHRAVVLLDGLLALRPEGDEILCEVISSGSLTPQAQVQNAKQLLEASTLGGNVTRKKCRWLVVEGYGTGIAELWRES
jgi:hypothetical protein